MIRENRYFVLKRKDTASALTSREIKRLLQLEAKVAVARSKAKKKPLKCVVVESDWPEYEPTWRAIEDRVTDEAAGGAYSTDRGLRRRESLKTGTYVHAPARWTYSRYRALLRLNGKAWATVSPDGKNALSKADAEVLLAALNGPVSIFTLSWSSAKTPLRK